MGDGLKVGIGKALLACIVVVIVAVAVVWAVGLVPTISSSSTVTLQRNSTFDFYTPGDPNASSVYAFQSSSSNAVVYLGNGPLLLNNVAVLYMSPGQSENVSLTGSGKADVNVALVSSSAQSITLDISYISPSLDVKQSPGVSMINVAGTATTAQPGQATSSATTVPAGSSSSTTAQSTAPTTSITQLNYSQRAILAVNSTAVGTLAKGYKSIFIKDAGSCTQHTYNNEFFAEQNTQPSGQTTFANTSLEVPTTMSVSVKAVSQDVYNVTYSEVTALGDRPFATVEYNLTSQMTVSSVFTGDFGNSYSEAFETYQGLNTTSDSCATYGV